MNKMFAVNLFWCLALWTLSWVSFGHWELLGIWKTLRIYAGIGFGWCISMRAVIKFIAEKEEKEKRVEEILHKIGGHF